MANVIDTVDGARWDLSARVEVISAGTRILLTINHDAPNRSTELCEVELPIEFAEEIAAALVNAVDESEGA